MALKTCTVPTNRLKFLNCLFPVTHLELCSLQSAQGGFGIGIGNQFRKISINKIMNKHYLKVLNIS